MKHSDDPARRALGAIVRSFLTPFRECAVTRQGAMPHRGTAALFLLGLASLPPYLGFAKELSSKAGILRHEMCFAIALALFVASILVARRLPASNHRQATVIIFLFAILFRGMLVFTDPPRTTDPYRYVWEGKMTTHGINPFLYPPDHPRLIPYRDEIYRDINNKSVATVYPATSQAAFALAYRLKPNSITTLKSIFAMLDIGTVAAARGLLAALGLPMIWCIVYAWHPLVVTELSLNGHQDGIGIFFLVISLYCFARRRPIGCGVSLALSVMAKGYSFLALPFLCVGFFRKKEQVREGADVPVRASPVPIRILRTSRRSSLIFAIAFVTTGAVLSWPVLSSGGASLKGMEQYLEHWERNAGAYFILKELLRPLESPAARVLRHIGVNQPPNVSDMQGDFAPLTKGFCFVILFTIFVLTLRHFPKDARGVIGRLLVFLAAFFILSPTVYPWYLCWTLPLLCVVFSPSWFLFTGLVVMNYLYNWYGEELAWIRFGEYLPLWIGLMIEYLVRRTTKDGADKECRISGARNQWGY